MQSTGQTSTQALSFTLMHGSAMIYAIRASRSQVLDEPHHFYPKPRGVSSLWPVGRGLRPRNLFPRGEAAPEAPSEAREQLCCGASEGGRSPPPRIKVSGASDPGRP